jgi:hypothetical protein
MAQTLVLMAAAHFDYRQMEAYLALNHALCSGLGFPRAPSRMTLWRAERRFPEVWLHRVNDEVLAGFKQSRAPSPTSCRSGLDWTGGTPTGRVARPLWDEPPLAPSVPQGPSGGGGESGGPGDLRLAPHDLAPA